MSKNCDPKDIALKCFFLGPQAENGPWVSQSIQEILSSWYQWRQSLFPQDGNAISQNDQDSSYFVEYQGNFNQQLKILLQRFEAEIPKFSPRYIGHMFSEISLPALIGHFITLLHNPNNVSSESSLVGTEIEKESITALCKMVGFKELEACGHFTSGGTIANFEAYLRARERFRNHYKKKKITPPPAVILVPASRHYS